MLAFVLGQSVNLTFRIEPGISLTVDESDGVASISCLCPGDAFVRVPVDGDRILATADVNGLRINRYAPIPVAIATR